MRPHEVQLGREISGLFFQAPEVVSSADVYSLASLVGKTPDGSLVLVLPDGRSTTLTPADDEARALVQEVRGDVADAFHSDAFYWIMGIISNGGVALGANIFPPSLIFASGNRLSIAITEAAMEDLRMTRWPDAARQLRNEFLLDDMAFVIAGDSRLDRGFSFVGCSRFCDVRQNGLGVYEAVRLRRRRSGNRPNAPTIMLRGPIEFVDATIAARVPTAVDSLLGNLFRQPDSFIATWEVYNEIESEIMRNEALAAGCARYSSYVITESGDDYEYRFRLTESAWQFSAGELEASAEPICEDTLPESTVSVGEVASMGVSGKEIITRLPAQDYHKRPPESGYLMVSLRGDRTRIRRRRRALERVKNATCPLPTLPLLLENCDAPIAIRRHMNPMSSRARKALGHQPTPGQSDALNIAINTPDIALIQGPPGTGKTSVIRALMARLSEDSQNRGTNASVLVTSYQHAAVDNAIRGTDMGGVPANRIGGKRGLTIEDKEREIWQWVGERKKAYEGWLQVTHGGMTLRNRARDTDRLIDRYRQVREASVSHVLNEILASAGPYLPMDLARKLQEAVLMLIRAENLQSPDPKGTGSPLAGRMHELIQIQRCHITSFADDGPIHARRLIKFIERHGEDLGVSIPPELRTAAAWDQNNGSPQELALFIPAFRRAVDALERSIGTRAPEPDELSQTIRELDILLSQVSDCLHRRAKESADGVAEAIEQLLEDFDDPEEVRRLVDTYSSIVAATCQQAAPPRGMENRSYDFVIVDEAARANPLDLLIPLSQARRIILVGDHAQLPQVLEPEALSTFASRRGSDVEQSLRISLFERLFTEFQRIESRGGPRRVITLQDDFRMHPTISKFISRTFYNGKVQARCKLEDRQHNLDKYDNKAIGWIDVGIRAGAESSGRSKTREAEVNIVLAEAEDVLRRNSEFNVGIVTFYAEQAREINSRIALWPHEWRSRVQVGTVDAFQGLEFDIVFLSAVRSNSIRDPEMLNRRVGFLSYRNRLCVALSRAKRLLVMVGDSATIAGTPNHPAVVELRELLGLCRSEEGYYELCR